MKKTFVFSVFFLLVTLFFLSNSYAQYTNTTLTDNTEGGYLLSRQSSISSSLTNWFISSRSNNQDLWFYASFINPNHGSPFTDYWNPLKFNFSLGKSIEITGNTSISGGLNVNGEIIGSSPSYINASLTVNGGSSQSAFGLTTTSTAGNRIIFNDGNGPITLYQKGGTSGYLDYGGTKLFNDGSVGIGTTTPGSTSYKLMVNGKIRANEIIVETGWSDFVFEKDYKLLSLPEVEKFIQKNKHLPDVPSEKEILENGVSLGEMQSTLLQKVEELTLYVIDQNKRIEKLEKENAELKK